MPVTYNLIANNTLSSSAASVTFSSIPSSYTDLVVRISARDNSVNTYLQMFFTYNNNTTAVYSVTKLTGTGSVASSTRQSTQTEHQDPLETSNNATGNTFSSAELYIPNYSGATYNKVYSSSSVAENNATTAGIQAASGLWRATTAISSIEIYPTTGSFVSGSSFYLYGIKNS